MIRLLDLAMRRVQGLFDRSDNENQATLDQLLTPNPAGRPLNEVFGGATDDFWLWCFTEGYRRNERLQALLPAFPSVDVQLRFAGASGDDTVRDAFAFYRLVRRLVEQHGHGQLRSVLEFGCGWGRIIRFFLRDIEPGQLMGIDCLPLAIEICQQSDPATRFSLVNALPPTTLASESFDLIYAYSVFSHLSEDAHRAWLEEFRRALKPLGLLIVTTRPRDFVLMCEGLRNSGEKAEWARGLITCFPDANEALARYDRGEYLYQPTGGGDVLDASFFGETCIPKGYVTQQWADLYEVLDYIDDRTLNLQNVIVTRKR
jgi:SAM-dependent methyltransferase